MKITSLKNRLISFAIDTTLAMIVFIALARILPSIGWILTIIIYFFYTTAFWSSKAQGTIGKYLVGSTVVDENGNRITYQIAIKRYLYSWISFVVFGFGYIMALYEKDRKSFHDMMAKTLVVDNKIQLEEGLYKAWLEQVKTLRK